MVLLSALPVPWIHWFLDHDIFGEVDVLSCWNSVCLFYLILVQTFSMTSKTEQHYQWPLSNDELLESCGVLVTALLDNYDMSSELILVCSIIFDLWIVLHT